TLGAALAVAQTLDGEARVLVESMARDAFTRGFNIASLVSSVLGVVAALVCFRFMKRDAVTGASTEGIASVPE
ncbi:MAG TPA: hypothetical protein VIT67_05145, partial [Povalibacter sp.]